MNKIKVIVDSTVDMSLEKLKELDVDMLPLSVNINNCDYLDYVEIKWNELIEKVKTYKTLPKTSAISVGTFVTTFEKYTNEGYDVIFLSLGSHFSCNYNNAITAKELVDGNIYIIDSQNLSSAIGLQLLKIIIMKNEGLSAEEIVKKMEDIVQRTQTETALETMEYLYKGGRCSGIKYLIGSLLRLYPIVKVNKEITVHKLGKVTFRNALDIIISDFKKDLDDGNVDMDYIIISSVGNKKAQNYMYNKISEFFDSKKILLYDAGCVVSTHCGPGTTGFFYIKNKNPKA